MGEEEEVAHRRGRKGGVGKSCSKWSHVGRISAKVSGDDTWAA